MMKIPCAIVRGGTTKGVFVREEYMPQDHEQRTRLLLNLMGSPDPRQIDGLGGADPLTSKVAIVSRSNRDGVDLEYESIEVGIAEATVNLGVMCGNLLCGVGAFAIAEGLIEAQAPVTTVRIYCRSNQKTVVAHVPCSDEVLDAAGLPPPEPGAAPVDLVFPNPGGAVTGKLLAVGEPLTTLALPQGRTLEVSIVDAGTLYAFARAEAFGLTGAEDAAALDTDKELRATIEAAREEIAGYINRQRFHGVPLMNPGRVKIAIIARPAAPCGEADILARVINRAKVHKAYAVSGAICLAAAAVIPGTLVNSLLAPDASPFRLRIGHPSGVLALSLEWSADESGIVVHAAKIRSSARIIMHGNAYVATVSEHSEAGAVAEAVMP